VRIAGVYPQRICIDPKIQHAVSEPYGLEMILAVAKEQGHDVELFLPVKEENGQMVSTSEEELVERILDYKPDVVGFSMYTCQFPMGGRVASAIKKREPRIITVGGNRYPTFLKENVNDPFDFFVSKEGELTWKQLLSEIERGHNYRNVKGLSFRNERGIFTGVRARNFDLDSLPNALRFDVILKQIYRGVSIPHLSADPHYAIVEYSRSCYNACKFCDNQGFWGNKLAFRSASRVVDELFELQDRGVDIFYFMDLNFSAVPEKVVELCNEINRRNLKISWYCMSNVATIDSRPDVLYALKEAGCYKIAWGIESTNDSSLERMGKRSGSDILRNEQAIRVLQKSLDVGLLNQGYYIIGFPWEDVESIVKDAENLKYLPLHILNVGIFTPIPLS